MNDLTMVDGREGYRGQTSLVPRGRSGNGDIVRYGMRGRGRTRAPMAFKDRFETVRTTPRDVCAAVNEENGRFKGLKISGVNYKPTRRFLKGLAQRMKVPVGVFELFTPLEVIERAAERAPDLQLRLTVDREENKALALVEDKGTPLPAGNIEIIMKDDRRLQEFSYDEGVITGRFDMGEAWDISGDSGYGVHVSMAVPVDGMGMPDATLATWREVCSNGAIAEAPIFRTKMQIKDSSGEHFRRLLVSFNNPHGIEMLHERLVAANETKASVDEVYRIESFIRRQVRGAREQMLLCERLQDIAGDPCVRYGVTDLGTIGERRRGLLPTEASVADVMNFVSELNTHHGDLVKNRNAADGLIGEFYAKGYDLEEMYPHNRPASGFYLKGLELEERAA